MALRDKLAARAVPYLEPGEQIQSVFLAQTGASPYWLLVSIWIVFFSAGYRIVVVTDRAVIVLRAGRWAPGKPKGLLGRWSRSIWLGRPTGLWGHVHIDRNYWVHKRFHRDVEAADAALHAMLAAGVVAPPQYGPPQ